MEISSTFIILFSFIFPSFSLVCFPIQVCKTVIEYGNLHWIAQFFSLYAVCICCVYVYHRVLSAFSAIFCTLLMHNWCSSHCQSELLHTARWKGALDWKFSSVDNKIPQKTVINCQEYSWYSHSVLHVM